MKDPVGDDRFERGWEAVERRFNQLSRAAADVEDLAPDEKLGVLRELEEIGSRVGPFADNWIHFYLRFACLTRELGGLPGEKPADGPGEIPEDLEVFQGGMYREFT